MKVVCIGIPPSFILLDLKIGQIFQAHYNNGYWYVVDELKNVIPCEWEVAKYFISLQEYRHNKLKQLEI